MTTKLDELTRPQPFDKKFLWIVFYIGVFFVGVIIRQALTEDVAEGSIAACHGRGITGERYIKREPFFNFKFHTCVHYEKTRRIFVEEVLVNFMNKKKAKFDYSFRITLPVQDKQIIRYERLYNTIDGTAIAMLESAVQMAGIEIFPPVKEPDRKKFLKYMTEQLERVNNFRYINVKFDDPVIEMIEYL